MTISFKHVIFHGFDMDCWTVLIVSVINVDKCRHRRIVVLPHPLVSSIKKPSA